VGEHSIGKPVLLCLRDNALGFSGLNNQPITTAVSTGTVNTKRLPDWGVVRKPEEPRGICGMLKVH